MTTIKDIAKAANVSITTVSRALNDYYDVNEETKKKIKQIAQDLGYSPNIAARSLVVKKTRTLGLLLSSVTRSSSKDNIAFEALCGMNDRAGELNYDLVLFSTTPQKQTEKSYKALCQERGVDGIIIMGIRLDDAYFQEIVSSPIPSVIIDITIKGNNVGLVTSDNVAGAKRAVTFLIENGHRKIGMINGHSKAEVSIKRLEGYKKGLKEAGLPFDESLVLDGQFSELGGIEATIRLLSAHPDMTAIFFASDLMALGAIQGVRHLGKKAPDDISIIGFDNIDLSGYTSPALTTINQNKYEMGYQAAQMMIDMLEGRDITHQLVLATNLIVRDSVSDISLKG
jgi:LacI family transcriptional regulator